MINICLVPYGSTSYFLRISQGYQKRQICPKSKCPQIKIRWMNSKLLVTMEMSAPRFPWAHFWVLHFTNELECGFCVWHKWAPKSQGEDSIWLLQSNVIYLVRADISLELNTLDYCIWKWSPIKDYKVNKDFLSPTTTVLAFTF